MRYLIRHMVCYRCELAVRELALGAGVPVVDVGLGYVEFARPLSGAALREFVAGLEAIGFAWIRSPEGAVAERVDVALRELVLHAPPVAPTELRAALTERLGYPYDRAAQHYREARGAGIGEEFARLRMVRACELLREGELQVSEVAYRLGYRHLSGFSRAFKRAWGLSPRDFAAGEGARPYYVAP